jgi:two-component system, chemotaxis family, chemotaxis protein CheY
MRALVVDDSTAMRTILSRMLRELGLEVAEARNGREALEYIAGHGPADVMLVDWNMPEMNGLELVRAVRQDLGQRQVMMMMVTTETETAQMVKALAAGANEYLMKPFTKEALIEKLDLLGVDSACARSES